MSILFVVGFIFMLLFPTTANVVNSYESNNTPQCIPKEREALLKFKTTLNDSEGDLSTWSNNSTNQNCCKWNYITCDGQTNHVIVVTLYGGGIYTLGGEIDSSLAELHHLKTLQLIGMNISRIPKFIGSLKELTRLDLRNNPISGIIPPQLGNLTKLEYLDLSKGTSQMTIDNPRWLSQLTSLISLSLSNFLYIPQQLLEFLKLYDNNLSGTILHDLLGNISSSSKNSLKSLHLSSNQLGGLIVDDFENTFPYLSELTLDNNQLEGNFPNRLKTFPNLEKLDVSHNQFVGLLPDLSSMPNLTNFKASNNKFSGTSSESIGKLDNLRNLDVSSNCLSGYISHVVNLQYPSLKYLDISYNLEMRSKFNSKYPIIPSFKLVFINLASCKLGPEFPNWLLTQTNLKHLDISNSSISGPLPNWFPNITSNLNYLNMSHNLLNNNLTDFPLSQEADPVLVDLSSNQFQGSIPPSLLVNATYLYLSNNKFNEFSSSLCEAKERDRSTQLLDLSNNNLFGNIPDCWENFTQLSVLNLGYNKLFGNIPNSINMTSIKTLQLRHNKFSGRFPSSLKYCTSLKVLDLGSNSLEGSIPSWIGEELNNLVFLSLKSNKFYGSIPWSLCQLTQIQILDLSSNDLSGPIPSCINNFTVMVQINSLETTISSDMILHDDRSCSNRSCSKSVISYENNASITWKGAQHEYVRILGLLRVIDLSSNKLNGEIPIEVTHLSQLGALNLSRNNLSGKIPRKIGKLINLEVLDLSHNRISGKIPIGLAEVSYLNYLDLSNNRLSGRIPTGTQLQGFNAAAYAMNLCLCGTPLPSSCPGDDDDESSHVPAYDSAHDDNDRNGGEWLDFSWFYKGIGGGFIIGFCGVCGNLLINNSWRVSYFRLMQNIGDWLYIDSIIYLVDEDVSSRWNEEYLENQLIWISILACFSFGFFSLFVMIINNLYFNFRIILDLHGMNISPIPKFIGSFKEFTNLDLSKNPISGFIIGFYGVFGNLLINNFWRASYFQLIKKKILFLMKIMHQSHGKGHNMIIDLSSNKLNGEIPMEVTHLSQLGALNLSRNNLSGKIPRKIGKLTNLQVLDFSYNKINGEIPTILAEVSSLSYLDLSNNRLAGRIPTGTQLQSFNASAYSMNHGLCGNPLPSSCPGDDDDESSHVPASNSARDDDGGEWFDLSLFYKGIGGGFTIGFCDIFDKYKNENEKFKESISSDIRGMLNLYEAAQMRVHGEKILDEALIFTTTHLEFSVKTCQLSSPYLDLVKHALMHPIRKSLQRREARLYISLYHQLPSHEEILLTLAKLDFNLLQKLHQKELSYITRWWKEFDYKSKHSFIKDRIVECYFWVYGVFFEAETSQIRLIITKLIAILTIIDDAYDSFGTLEELEPFTQAIERWDICAMDTLPEYMKIFYMKLLEIYNEIEQFSKEKSYCPSYAKKGVQSLIRAYFKEAKWLHTKYIPTLDEYMPVGVDSAGSFMLISMVFIGMGDIVTKHSMDWIFSNPQPKIIQTMAIVGRVMNDIGYHKSERKKSSGEIVASTVECYMKQYGVTGEEAIEKLSEQVKDSWKDLNEDLLNPITIPRPLLMQVLKLLFEKILSSINITRIKILQLRLNNLLEKFSFIIKILHFTYSSRFGEQQLKFEYTIESLSPDSYTNILDISSNDLCGAIPSCIKNFTTMVRVDYSDILGLLRIIDLLSNKLNTEISIEVTHLSQLALLNLSINNLFEEIPRKIGKLAKLEVLDLSHNKINGEIPISLAEEKFLPVLNYKHSMLLHLPRILDLICGSPLSSSCPEDDDGESSHVSASNLAQDDNGGEWFDLSWFYKRIGGGLIIEFCSVCGNLLINNSWRASYFVLMQNIGDWFYSTQEKEKAS
ncbi:hypothetical protein G4B88_030144 [Cannabis sativa]|uniref:Uncharacterized protein n=1 Tax=Cannabis sativa TaxID=3483 RepID=A0A7J6E042_CANSA|nr:hypothetical protein G4B88_030144 [Cannabis sativa]